MVHVIADVLKSTLSGLTWIEKFGGLVIPAIQPVYAPLEGTSQQVKIKDNVYPVACGTSQYECWDKGAYKIFNPDSTKTAIAFFADNGGVQIQRIDGPKNALLTFSFDIRFLCWMNLQRIGWEGCSFSGMAVPYVVAQFVGRHSADGLFDGGIEESAYREIAVTGIRQLAKDPGMFRPFSFADEGNTRGIFLYPYDYFGLQITGTFQINKNCLPELFAGGFTASEPGCIPAGSEHLILQENGGAILTESGSPLQQE